MLEFILLEEMRFVHCAIGENGVVSFDQGEETVFINRGLAYLTRIGVSVFVHDLDELSSARIAFA